MSPTKRPASPKPLAKSNAADEKFFYLGTVLGAAIFALLIYLTQWGLAQSRTAYLPLTARVSLSAPEPRESASIESVLAPPTYPQRDFSVAEPQIAAEAALIFTFSDERLLFEKASHEPFKIASLTKILTAIATLDTLPLEKRVIITGADVDTYGQAGDFKAGEVFFVRDLLTAMLVQSSNDAAEALASGVTGGLLPQINKLIADLGLENTEIETVTGLDGADNHATAFDLMRVMLYAANYQEIWRLAGLKNATIYELNTRAPHYLISTNKLLGRLGVLGGKTGFTTEAQETYLAIFTTPADQKLGLVILKSPDRFADAQVLINWVNKAYQW